MKRFSSLFQSALLAAALVVPVCAKAQSNSPGMYLVPVSSTAIGYYPGQTIQFAALVDIPEGTPGPITLTLGATVTYDTSIFDINAITADPDTSAYPPKPSVHLWDLVPPLAYSKTTDGLDTFQLGVGHTRQVLQPGNKTTTIPAGTYTIGTFSFPILATAQYGKTTISLPSAYGKTGPNAAIDFINNTNGLGTNNLSLVFPNTGGKYSQLTYTIGPPYVQIYAGVVNFEGAFAPTVVVFRPKNGGPSYTVSSNFGSYYAELPIQPYIVHVTASNHLSANVDSEQGHPVTFPETYWALPVATLRAGDVNSDNSVDIADFGILLAAYGSRKSDPTSHYDPNADFNNDGTVDLGDFALLVTNFGSMGDL